MRPHLAFGPGLVLTTLLALAPARAQESEDDGGESGEVGAETANSALLADLEHRVAAVETVQQRRSFGSLVEIEVADYSAKAGRIEREALADAKVDLASPVLAPAAKKLEEEAKAIRPEATRQKERQNPAGQSPALSDTTGTTSIDKLSSAIALSSGVDLGITFSPFALSEDYNKWTEGISLRLGLVDDNQPKLGAAYALTLTSPAESTLTGLGIPLMVDSEDNRNAHREQLQRLEDDFDRICDAVSALDDTTTGSSGDGNSDMLHVVSQVCNEGPLDEQAFTSFRGFAEDVEDVLTAVPTAPDASVTAAIDQLKEYDPRDAYVIKPNTLAREIHGVQWAHPDLRLGLGGDMELFPVEFGFDDEQGTNHSVCGLEEGDVQLEVALQAGRFDGALNGGFVRRRFDSDDDSVVGPADDWNSALSLSASFDFVVWMDKSGRRPNAREARKEAEQEATAENGSTVDASGSEEGTERESAVRPGGLYTSDGKMPRHISLGIEGRVDMAPWRDETRGGLFDRAQIHPHVDFLLSKDFAFRLGVPVEAITVVADDGTSGVHWDVPLTFVTMLNFDGGAKNGSGDAGGNKNGSGGKRRSGKKGEGKEDR